MLILSRKIGERVRIGDNVEVTVTGVQGGRVQLAFNAPQSVSIHRADVHKRLAANQPANCQPAAPMAVKSIGVTPCP